MIEKGIDKSYEAKNVKRFYFSLSFNNFFSSTAKTEVEGPSEEKKFLLSK